ncbi:MAG TPA: SdrD B-like domain-containing protein, partial [Roseiflexaceae bacterium]|nr:SdrD B-like domain-containing protein [Roseiflexaceae bacterium]
MAFHQRVQSGLRVHGATRAVARGLHHQYAAFCLLAGLLSLLSMFQQSAFAADFPAITGLVYQDYNANGVQDSIAAATSAADRGIGAVKVTLYAPDGTVAGSTTSQPDGNYVITPTVDGPYRIEFTDLPVGFRPAPHGSDNGSTVQFVPAGVPATVDLGILLPGDYCQDNPTLITSCFRYGDQLQPNVNPFPDSSSLPTVITFDNNAGASVGTPLGAGLVTPYDLPDPGTLAIGKQVGTVWGLAYARTTKQLYASAFMKKHADFGPSGPGAVYVIDPATNSVLSTFTVPGATTDPHDPTNYVRDNGNVSWNLVGKAALGGMQLSTDETRLFVMNLEDRALYVLNSQTGAVLATSAAPINNVPLIAPAPANTLCNPNDVRPFAVHMYKEQLYVGMVCSAESTPTVDSFQDGTNGCPANGEYDVAFQGNGFNCAGENFTDVDGNTIYNRGDTRYLQAMVYRVDPATLAWSAAPVFQFPLSYPRTKAIASQIFNFNISARWRPWIASFAGYPAAPLPEYHVPSYPQPWLTDLDFDQDGNMLIALRDRYGDQMGNGAQSNPGDNEFYSGTAVGDLLRACFNGSTWALENNGSCGGLTTAGANTGQGPGGGEFFFQDELPASFGQSTVHDEFASGALLELANYPDIVATMVEPIYVSGQFWDTGFRWMNKTDGTTQRSYRILNGEKNLFETFGKSNGLGDIIALCDAAPVEIGNRVWYDVDRDGVQDPGGGEPPLPGVQVELVDVDNQVIGTATTDANGNYYFSNANGTSSASALYNLPIDFGGTYTVRINLSQEVISGPDYRVTVANSTGGIASYINDSDGL